MTRPGRAAILVPVLLGLILSMVVGLMLARSVESTFPSSFSGKPEGALAFRRLLEQLEIETGTFTRSWESLPAAAETLLIVATPLPRPPSSDEAAALDQWLRSGGALLVVDDASLFRRPEALDELLASSGLPTAPAAPYLGDGGITLARPRLAGAHEVFAPGGNGTLARDPLDDIPLHAEGNFLPDFSGLPLAMRPDGAVVAASAPLGEGRITRVLGPLVSNDRLLQGDLLPFALGVVADLRTAGSEGAGRSVLFDEYHQGYGGLSPKSGGLATGALVGAAAAALAASLLVALARGIRFGPARVRAGASRRSGMEFVDSIAGLYRRAGFREHALDVALGSFAREARLRFGPGAGMTGDAGAEALARAVAEHSALDYETLHEPLRAAERARHDPHLSEAGMTGLVARVSSLHAEVFHGR